MTYVIGALTVQSNIEMPASYDVFRNDSISENIEDNSLRLELASASPDLSHAVKRATHELMTVWETEDAWIYESTDHRSYMTVSRDYTNAHYFCGSEDFVVALQPLLQALIECCLIYIGTAIIHASCVSIDGEAVLFSAPSGTGKSTRAKQWCELLDATWISGDRPAIQPMAGIVHGVPWDGKDQIFVNTVAPVRAIAKIGRADRTYAREMTVKQKRDFLSTQLLIPMWDIVLVQKAFVAMRQIIDRLPIYHLFCGITEESIRESYEILFRYPERILEQKEEHIMRMKKDFTVVNVVGDYMVVPVGENAATFGGTVVINEITAFILKAMNKPVSEEELLECMLNEYDIDHDTAVTDLREILETLKEMGIIE